MLTGKECKLTKSIGQKIVRTIGGDAFSIDISKNLLDFPQQIASSLLPGIILTDLPCLSLPDTSLRKVCNP